jgi:hypothetical protein
MSNDKMVEAVNRLFSRLADTYGEEWDRSLGKSLVSSAKSVWIHELSIFENSLERCAWALENLPNRAPNSIVFKNLCRSAPGQESKALPEPAADPVRMARELRKLGQIKTEQRATVSTAKDWAHRLKARHARGEALNQYQVLCYKFALKEAV